MKRLKILERSRESFSSVQFSSVQLLSLVWLFATPWMGSITRPPCPSPTPGVYPSISSSVIPFSSCPQSLPASGSFPMSQLFAWGGQILLALRSPHILFFSFPFLKIFFLMFLHLPGSGDAIIILCLQMRGEKK